MSCPQKSAGEWAMQRLSDSTTNGTFGASRWLLGRWGCGAMGSRFDGEMPALPWAYTGLPVLLLWATQGGLPWRHPLPRLRWPDQMGQHSFAARNFGSLPLKWLNLFTTFSSIHRGFSIAMFDYQRAHMFKTRLIVIFGQKMCSIQQNPSTFCPESHRSWWPWIGFATFRHTHTHNLKRSLTSLSIRLK